MSMQIFALIVVVIAFTVLVGWVFLPANRKRYETQARSILDDDTRQGDGS